MDLKQLRALLAIAETGSVTRAADILHLVQPAVTRQLKLLEEELGVSLFDRERQGMVLTTAGRRFHDSAKRALAELDGAKAAILPRIPQIEGSVDVGFFPSAAELLVARLMSHVRQKYPKLQVRSFITYLPDLEQSLESGDVDVALLYIDPESGSRFPREPLLEDSLYLVGPIDAALDMDTPVALADLTGVPLILPVPPNAIRRLVDRACAAQRLTLNITAETDTTAVQKALVMNGAGLTMLSGFVVAEDVRRGQLSASPLPGLRRTLYLARSAGQASSAAASCVLDELRDHVQQMVLQGRWPGATLISNP